MDKLSLSSPEHNNSVSEIIPEELVSPLPPNSISSLPLQPRKFLLQQPPHSLSPPLPVESKESPSLLPTFLPSLLPSQRKGKGKVTPAKHPSGLLPDLLKCEPPKKLKTTRVHLRPPKIDDSQAIAFRNKILRSSRQRQPVTKDPQATLSPPSPHQSLILTLPGVEDMLSFRLIDKAAPLEFYPDVEAKKEFQDKEKELMQLTRKLGASRLRPNHRIPFSISALFRFEVIFEQPSYTLSDVSVYPSRATKWEKQSTSFLSYCDPNTFMASFKPPANGLFKICLQAHEKANPTEKMDLVVEEETLFVPFAIDLEDLRPTRNVRIEHSNGIAVYEEKGLIFVSEYEKDCIKVLNSYGDLTMFYDFFPKPCDLALSLDNCLVIIGSMEICKLSLSKISKKVKFADLVQKGQGNQEIRRATRRNIVATQSYPDNDFCSVAVSPVDGYIYVLQSVQRRVLVTTPDLIRCKIIGRPREGLFGPLGHLQAPKGIAVDKEDMIYVTDVHSVNDFQEPTSGEIYKYHRDGQYLDHIHCAKFVPHKITTCSDGLLYVTGRENGVVVFTNFGQLVRKIEVKKPAIAIDYNGATLAYTSGRRLLVLDHHLPPNLKEMPDTTVVIKDYD